ncbi:PepSY domain-containing protein [Streptomyces spongiae]|uniref:PepSY domain-containing protein n=1 Tax=Streptomyces spongiae TaxID=565072 RepID=A0A5N8XPK8_9ACTN|nr:PepSY domain-containing protein [Streptomyces spongiae]MPY60495.1 PepSY domain-containing protein [Streptomyces spongiae]
MKRNIVIATIAAAALVGGGTATALAVSGDDEAPAQRSNVQVQDDNGRDDVNGADNTDDADDANDKAENAAEAKAAKVTAADAITAALKEKSGTAVGAELDTERTNVVWEVEILASGNTWHSVQVDPGTGKVLDSRTEQEDPEDAAQARAALKGSSVSAAEAAEAAEAKGPVNSVDLDDEGRAHAWDVDTTDADGVEHDWNVGLDSAKVTADRSTDDADDLDD